MLKEAIRRGGRYTASVKPLSTLGPHDDAHGGSSDRISAHSQPGWTPRSLREHQLPGPVNRQEVVRSIYDIDDPDVADDFVSELADDLQHKSRPSEVRSLGRTLARWHDQIVAWHHARVMNAATEAMNNLIKRVKRVAFGFMNFRHYRIRALLYAGHPNWSLLATVTP